MKKQKKPLIDAWEVVTCKNGHPCYIVVKPVYEDNNDLIGYGIALVDTKGSTHEECPTCKEPIWSEDKKSGTMTLHIKGKKRKGFSPVGRGFVY